MSTGGATGKWWFCNGLQIYLVAELPAGATHYKTNSIYFCGGHGFWVMPGNATSPTDGQTWHRLRFDLDENDGFTAYMSTAGQYSTLFCRRPDQPWVKMLLPDIYHGRRMTDPRYGQGLTGELPIFLGLIAFAIQKDDTVRLLPEMMKNSYWQTYKMPHGRELSMHELCSLTNLRHNR